MRKYITDYSSRAFYLCIFVVYFISFIPFTFESLDIFFLLRFGSSRNYSPQIIIIYFLSVVTLSFLAIIFSIILKNVFLYLSAIINKFFYWISSSIIVISFSFIAFISKLIIFIQYGLYSRHSDIFRIQSTGFLGIAHTLSFYYLLNYLIFNTIYYFSQIEKRSNLQKISFIFALFAFSILINSSFGTMVLLVSIVYNFSWLKKLDFFGEIKGFILKSKIKLNFIFFIIFTILSVIFIISVGFINKSIGSFQNALLDINVTILNVFIRLTTHSDSLLRLLNGCDLECKFFNPLSGFFWRLSYFLDKNSYSGQILTPHRINFLNTHSEEVSQRLDIGGSSPGILASFLLGEPIILTFIFVLLLCSFFIFNMRLMFRSIGFSLISTVLYYLAYAVTLSSPLNYLLIFTPNMITIVFLSVYSFKARIRDQNS